MLTEFLKCKQVSGDRFRRWFSDGRFDLIIWYEDREIFGFQLCYDKSIREHALTWRKDVGWSHHKVDDGEWVRGVKGTPILVSDGEVPITRIIEKFELVNEQVDKTILDFVYEKLEESRIAFRKTKSKKN